MDERIGRMVALLAVAGGLAACGGGGSGGSGGGSTTPTLSVTADRTSLQFIGFTTAPPNGQSITFTLVNAGTSGEFYGQIVPDRPEDFSASFTPNGTTSAVVVVTPLRLPTSVHSGVITFRLCSDVNCNKVAWSQAIPYTTGLFTVDASGLTLSGYEGVTNAPAGIAVSPADTSNQLTVTTAMTSGTGWLSAKRATDSSFAVTASAATVATGSYQGEVRISVAGQTGGPTVSIPVAFTVGDGTIAPPAGTVDLGLNGTLATMTGTATVAFRGTQSPKWTASSDQPWLVLDQAEGSGAGQVKYAVDPSKTGDIANWGSAKANIKISATGLSDVRVPVTLNKKLPEVYAVSPAVVKAGSAGTVRVTGRGLSQLTGTGLIQLAGVGGLTTTVISDTSASLKLPALAAGRASMSIPNAAGIMTTATTVGAASLNALPAAVFSTTGSKRSSFFDPTRQALFAVDTTQNLLVRFTYGGGQWQASSLAVERIGDMAMAPDRRTVYVVSGDATLLAVDPDTLTVRTSHVAPGAQWDGSLWTGAMSTRGLPVTSNLRLWFGPSVGASARYFDMLSQSFGAKTSGTGLPFSSSMSASGDGSVMWLGLGVTSTYDPQGFLYGAGGAARLVWRRLRRGRPAGAGRRRGAVPHCGLQPRRQDAKHVGHRHRRAAVARRTPHLPHDHRGPQLDQHRPHRHLRHDANRHRRHVRQAGPDPGADPGRLLQLGLRLQWPGVLYDQPAG